MRRLSEALRLPPAGNVDQELARLRTQRLITRRASQPPWSLTPEGSERVRTLIGQLEPIAMAAELAAVPGAELGQVLHTVIPPALAPIRWAAAIERMLRDHPFERNVFCMTRFPEDRDDSRYLDPVRPVLAALREAVASHGLTMHLASDRQLDDDLYGNVAAHMWACQFGLALFEDRLGRGVNENMLIEVGSMLVTGRRCALLKDKTIKKMPTNFVGHIYKSADFADVEATAALVHSWAADDLGFPEST